MQAWFANDLFMRLHEAFRGRDGRRMSVVGKRERQEEDQRC